VGRLEGGNRSNTTRGGCILPDIGIKGCGKEEKTVLGKAPPGWEEKKKVSKRKTEKRGGGKKKEEEGSRERGKSSNKKREERAKGIRNEGGGA